MNEIRWWRSYGSCTATNPIQVFTQQQSGCFVSGNRIGGSSRLEQEWAKNKQQREQRLQRIGQELAKAKGEAKPQWYVTSQGQTMVVIPGPVEFLMGSPPTESKGR